MYVYFRTCGFFYDYCTHYKALRAVFSWGTNTASCGGLYSCTVVTVETASETSFVSALCSS